MEYYTDTKANEHNSNTYRKSKVQLSLIDCCSSGRCAPSDKDNRQRPPVEASNGHDREQQKQKKSTRILKITSKMSCLLVAHSFTHRKKRGRRSVSLVSEVGNDVFHRFCFGSFFFLLLFTHFSAATFPFFSTATSRNSRSLNLLYFISCFTRLLTFTLDASLLFIFFSFFLKLLRFLSFYSFGRKVPVFTWKVLLFRFFCDSFCKAQHSPWCWGKTVICYVLWIFFTLGRNVPAQFLFCCKVMFAAAGITIKQFSTCQSPVRGWLHDEMSVCVCVRGKVLANHYVASFMCEDWWMDGLCGRGVV